jgi:hypothetical protein
VEFKIRPTNQLDGESSFYSFTLIKKRNGANRFFEVTPPSANAEVTVKQLQRLTIKL